MRLDSPSGLLFRVCTLTAAFSVCESPISVCIHAFCLSILHQIWPKSLKKLFVLLDVILHLLVKIAQNDQGWHSQDGTCILEQEMPHQYAKHTSTISCTVKSNKVIYICVGASQKNSLFPESFWRTVRHHILVPSASHKQPLNMTVAGFPPNIHDLIHTRRLQPLRDWARRALSSPQT